jgi:hypothetical protein
MHFHQLDDEPDNVRFFSGSHGSALSSCETSHGRIAPIDSCCTILNDIRVVSRGRELLNFKREQFDYVEGGLFWAGTPSQKF